MKIKKMLILGSGALKIGEAGEFDYSGSQAIKAMKEEGITTILVNPNIATIQTSKNFADRIYFLPVNALFVSKIIEKERPDAIFLSFGGQTALNCGIELERNGILKNFNVKVLGTPIETIKRTEDRKLFVDALKEIGVKTPESIAVSSEKEAIAAAKKIKFPLVIRVAYALGGHGSGIAYDMKQFRNLVAKAFSHTSQILVEEYLEGWKEVEYEVVRDCYDNCITVCNMENFDPMGVHTGESIVVAPSQTLTNAEYHKLRDISIKVIRHLKIVGECNIQFALDPKSEDYRVVEVNARLSRSSALASKATGYPLAFIAAKLALGYSLTELQNQITKKTMACFEPALDYVVVKIPRWDLQKFRKVSESIGTEMKSVGEVMAIGRTFEEAIQKAVRMLNIGMYGLVLNKISFGKLSKILKNPTDKRLFAIVDAIKRGYSIEKINKFTHIDKWFLYKIKNIINLEYEIRKYNIKTIPRELLLKAKKLGFSDKQLSMVFGNKDELRIRKIRKKLGILPLIKQIDTLAGEYPAETNYLYSTYNGTENDTEPTEKKSIIVLGSGPYSIGSSVEFDWCGVSAVKTLKQLGYTTIMINSNPETVSTDYDVTDLLYFEELALERILDVYEREKPLGIIIPTGGQIPNSLALKLHKAGVKILGTSALDIDRAEDRYKFSNLCDSLGLDQPDWKELSSEKDILNFGERVGYPVLIRPSYVLSGSAMSVAYNASELKTYLHRATMVSEDHPVIISKFIENAKEIEIDAVAKNGRLIVWAIIEHIENAGVHSGDATMVIPPQKMYVETSKQILNATEKLASTLRITGPFNIQFITKDNKIKIIECNLRASRSAPFVSKVLGTNFIDLAIRTIMGEKILSSQKQINGYVGVKAPQFSFSRLRGADPLLSVEMSSTGEVACLGSTVEDAFLKSVIAAGFKLPKKNILVSIAKSENKSDLLDEIRELAQNGFKIFATENTSKFLSENGIRNKLVYKIHEVDKKPNIFNYLKNKKFDLVICIPNIANKQELEDGYTIRRAAIDFSVPLLTNKQITKFFIKSIIKKKINDLEIEPWDFYVK